MDGKGEKHVTTKADARVVARAAVPDALTRQAHPTHPVVSRVVGCARRAGLVPRSSSRVAVYPSSLAFSHGAGRELVRELVLLRLVLVNVAFPVVNSVGFASPANRAPRGAATNDRSEPCLPTPRPRRAPSSALR